MPRSAPTRTGSMPSPASRRAWARANAGIKWPPVPPPARRIFIVCMISDCGLRIADYPGLVRSAMTDASREARSLQSAIRNPQSAIASPPQSAISCSRTPPATPNADQHSGRHQCDEEARPPIGDEGQRDAGRGQEREAYSHVERGGDADQPREPDRQQLAERLARRPRDAEPEPNERAEQDEDPEDAQEAPLLTDGREDEIGVGVREVAELLLSLSQPHAEQPPGADPDERLVDLPRRLGRRAARIQERDHASEPVLRARDGAEEHRRGRQPEREEVPDTRAGGEQHDAREQGHEQRHREVRLEKDQGDHGRQHDDERQQPVLKGPDALALLGGEHRGPEDDPELGELGWLHRDESEVDPATRAVDGRSEGVREGEEGEQQQHGDHAEHRPGGAPPAAVVRAREERGDDAAHRRAERLLQSEARADLPARDRKQARGPVHRREAEHHEDRGHEYEETRLPADVSHVESRLAALITLPPPVFETSSPVPHSS